MDAAATRGRDLALIGLGANIGDPSRQLSEAARALAELLDELRCSSVYRSAPEGFADQPPYLNAVCTGWSELSPEALLGELQAVEDRLGRVRTFRNAPRTIDLDLLGLGSRSVFGSGTVVPHPRMADRAFVLVPLVEVAPEWRHPVLGRTASEMLAALGAVAGDVTRLGPLVYPASIDPRAGSAPRSPLRATDTPAKPDAYEP